MEEVIINISKLEGQIKTANRGSHIFRTKPCNRNSGKVFLSDF